MRVNTPTVGAAALAFYALLPLGFTGAEEIYRETRGVSCLPGESSCSTFQGYIYVRRDAAPARSDAQAGGDAQFGERRLYLHLGAD